MRTIIAGSRTIRDYVSVCDAVEESGFDVSEIVSGGARGVDKLGERYAKDKNIDLKVFPADWEAHGKRAGILRNTEMAEYADALIAVISNNSKGTTHMIKDATEKGLKVFVKKVENNSTHQGNESLADW